MKTCDNCSAPISPEETRCKACLNGDGLSRYRDAILLLVTGLVICGAWIVADVVTPTNHPWGGSHSLHFVAMLSGITFGLMLAHWGICYMWEIYHERRQSNQQRSKQS